MQRSQSASPVIRHRLPKPELRDSAPFNTWFQEKFPEAVERFGPGFMEGRYEDQDGDTHFIPVALNEDAWAAALSGREELGLRLVFFPPEDTFYFLDGQVADGGAFCPTSVEKVMVLLSNQLMRCAEAMPPIVDIEPLFVKFRQPAALRSVVEKAKVILSCADDFFTGGDGQKRIVGGKLITPTAQPPHLAFIQEVLVPEPEAHLSVTDCYHTYYLYAQARGFPPPSRTEFTATLKEAIRAAFNLGLRHDVPAKNGKQTNGWRGISLRPLETLTGIGNN